MSDDFFDDEDPFFLASDRLDAGEKPQKVYAWAKKMRSKAKDEVLRDQWDEVLHYIEAEYPNAGLR